MCISGYIYGIWGRFTELESAYLGNQVATGLYYGTRFSFKGICTASSSSSSVKRTCYFQHWETQNKPQFYMFQGFGYPILGLPMVTSELWVTRPHPYSIPQNAYVLYRPSLSLSSTSAHTPLPHLPTYLQCILNITSLKGIRIRCSLLPSQPHYAITSLCPRAKLPQRLLAQWQSAIC